MKVTNYEVDIESLSPLSQSKYYEMDELEGELKAEFERRTWRERMHVTDDGYIFIPPMAFKNALSSAAAYLSMKIKGQGNKTYTKKIESGIACLNPTVLGIKKDEVYADRLFVPSDGKRGGGKRVLKYFPVIPNWNCTVSITVLDPIISQEVLEEHLEAAGFFIGIGRFRPEKNGYYGRFKIVDVKKV